MLLPLDIQQRHVQSGQGRRPPGATYRKGHYLVDFDKQSYLLLQNCLLQLHRGFRHISLSPKVQVYKLVLAICRLNVSSNPEPSPTLGTRVSFLHHPWRPRDSLPRVLGRIFVCNDASVTARGTEQGSRVQARIPEGHDV